MRKALRVTGTVVGFLLAGLVLPVGVGELTADASWADLYAHRTGSAAPAPAPPAHDPDKPTAVVVTGANGAVVSDALAPYEILATTGAFNVYAVAPTDRPVPLTGGLDLVPDLTLAELDAVLGGAAADVIVVPALPDQGAESTKPVTGWLTRQSAAGALILSVCNGSGVLASAGLLDGRDATAHWYRIDEFGEDYPAVNWIRGTRYVDDGDIITTAGILSGIDGTLRVVERLAGPEAAARTATTIGWRHYSPGTAASMGQARLGPADAAIAGLNAAFGWDRPTVGVLLTDGVGEIELASVHDTYGQSLAAGTLSVAPGPVRSRHGLTFVPRADPATADLDRLVVPGAAAAAAKAADRYADPVYVHGGTGFAFDGVLLDLAATADTATAGWAAKVLEYPTDHLTLTGSSWPWTLTLRPFCLAAIGLFVAFAVYRVVRARRSTVPRADAASCAHATERAAV